MAPLIRDLVRPSSGLRELLIRWRRQSGLKKKNVFNPLSVGLMLRSMADPGSKILDCAISSWSAWTVNKEVAPTFLTSYTMNEFYFNEGTLSYLIKNIICHFCLSSDHGKSVTSWDKIIESTFIYFRVRYSSEEGGRGRGPRRTRNTSRFTAI